MAKNKSHGGYKRVELKRTLQKYSLSLCDAAFPSLEYVVFKDFSSNIHHFSGFLDERRKKFSKTQSQRLGQLHQ